MGDLSSMKRECVYIGQGRTLRLVEILVSSDSIVIVPTPGASVTWSD